MPIQVSASDSPQRQGVRWLGRAFIVLGALAWLIAAAAILVGIASALFGSDTPPGNDSTAMGIGIAFVVGSPALLLGLVFIGIARWISPRASEDEEP